MNKQILFAALAVLAAQGASAADIAAGAKIADAQCAACHGKDGKTPTDPTYPMIAGQYPDYLLKALNDYHKGLRKNPIMGAAGAADAPQIVPAGDREGAPPAPLLHFPARRCRQSR